MSVTKCTKVLLPQLDHRDHPQRVRPLSGRYSLDKLRNHTIETEAHGQRLCLIIDPSARTMESRAVRARPVKCSAEVYVTAVAAGSPGHVSHQLHVDSI